MQNFDCSKLKIKNVFLDNAIQPGIFELHSKSIPSEESNTSFGYLIPRMHYFAYMSLSSIIGKQDMFV